MTSTAFVKTVRNLVLVATWGWGLFGLGLAQAQDTSITNNAPVASVSDTKPAVDPNDFPAFLVAHETQLTPFYSTYSGQIEADFWEVYGVYGRLVVSILIGILLLDAILGRFFAAYAAPKQATFVRTFFYSAGKMLMSLLTLAVACFGLFMLLEVAGHFTGSHSALIVLIVICVLMLIVQTILTHVVFGSSYPVSFFFILISTSIAYGLISVYFIFQPIKLSQHFYEFTDRIIAKIDSEKERVKGLTDDTQKKYDQIISDLQSTQAAKDKADHDKEELQAKIKAKLESDELNYAKIADIHVQGDLAATIKAYNDFIQQYPMSSFVVDAKQQITNTQTELDNQIAAKKAQDLQDQQTAALQEAALVAKIKIGQATLSEMLSRLHFKNREEVRAFLGPPSQVDIDAWGFDRPIVFNPDDKKSYGLKLNFADDKVQSVGYFYGANTR